VKKKKEKRGGGRGREGHVVTQFRRAAGTVHENRKQTQEGAGNAGVKDGRGSERDPETMAETNNTRKTKASMKMVRRGK